LSPGEKKNADIKNYLENKISKLRLCGPIFLPKYFDPLVVSSDCIMD
jgi:hypothetical protein